MSQAIMHISRLAWPTAWDEIYKRKAPLILELGFGTGHYLIDLARKRPDCNVLGLEISLPSLRRGAKKQEHTGLTNLRILQADSQSALWLLFTQESISEVVINFPDPWPKAGHHHRRLISNRFLTLLGTRMVKGATLSIATDHEEYAAAIQQTLENSPYFENRLSGPFLTSDTTRLHTKYEKIAISEGRTCRYFRYQRNATIILEKFPSLEVSTLPHVVLSCPLPLDEFGPRFAPNVIEVEDVHIKYLDLYRSTHENVLLVEIYVTEEPYHQRICLAIRSRKTGDIIVSPHPVGFPRPTSGLHLAVYHLVQWILTLHPDTTIGTSTLNIPSEQAK